MHINFRQLERILDDVTDTCSRLEHAVDALSGGTLLPGSPQIGALNSTLRNYKVLRETLSATIITKAETTLVEVPDEILAQLGFNIPLPEDAPPPAPPRGPELRKSE